MSANIVLLSGLKLSRKFLILGVIALVLAAVPFYQFYSVAQRGVESAARELSGFEPTRTLLRVVNLTQEHRGLAAGAFGGDAKLAAQLPNKRGDVDKALAELDRNMQGIAEKGIQSVWGEVRQEWNTVGASVADRAFSAAESFAAHTHLIEDYLSLLDLMLDHFGLSLDPKPESAFLVGAAYVTIPQMNEALGQLRGLGTGYLAKASEQRRTGMFAGDVMSLHDRSTLASLNGQAQFNLEKTSLLLKKAMNAMPELKRSLEGPLSRVEDMTKRLLVMIDDEVADSQTWTLDAPKYFGDITETIGEQLKLSDVAVAALGEVLDETASSLRFSQIMTSAIIATLMALGVLFALVVIRTVLNPVSHLQGVMEKLRQGDTTVRANITSRDEIGELAQQFDRMVDEREAVAAQIKAENEKLNDSVLKLLQGVARLSQRDLTAKVEVSEDVTGAVSDALNLLASDTARVLKEVTDISADVSSVSLKVKQQSDTVLATAEAERKQVETTAEELQIAAQAMRQISQLAQSANTAADNAIKTTESALATVTATVGGINSTRDIIRETEKRIKRLGERSQEISGVVGLINTIAERTHILALNASMHAASAGEAGRGFAVVAEEVQRLAENARQATGQIATLVNNIQVETVDTVNTMNSAISQVVDGSKMAEQAGEQMKLTQRTTTELVDSVRQIAVSSQKQAQISSGLLKRAGDIRKSTEETSRELTEQAGQTDNLVQYAKALLGAVRVFRLPA